MTKKKRALKSKRKPVNRTPYEGAAMPAQQPKPSDVVTIMRDDPAGETETKEITREEWDAGTYEADGWQISEESAPGEPPED